MPMKFQVQNIQNSYISFDMQNILGTILRPWMLFCAYTFSVFCSKFTKNMQTI